MALEILDVSNPDTFEHGFPHDFFRALRREAPVAWHEGDVYGGPGYWILSRYDDVRCVSKNPRLFVSGKGNLIEQRPEAEMNTLRSMIAMDPPAHPRSRKLVSGGFTPSATARLESKTRERVRAILDQIANKGECDFVSDVAAELPLQVIADLLGVPQDDRHQLFDWSNKLLGSEDPEYGNDMAVTMAAGIEMMQYAYKLGQNKIANPGDDLVTSLMTHEVDGEKLDMLEYGSFFLLLAIAGNETTRNLISHGLLLLLDHPEQMARLCDDPSGIPAAVEEMLRYRAPVMYFRRTATEDTEIRGTRIREGDKVTLWYPSANRDEDVFEDPDRFDIARHPNEHVAFGHGQHFCLGSHLARMEIRVMFEELLRRLPDIELAGDVRMLRSHFIDGIKSIPVKFSPETA
jgi:cholest-4-en-3-one 26-monooxygenase